MAVSKGTHVKIIMAERIMAERIMAEPGRLARIARERALSKTAEGTS